MTLGKDFIQWYLDSLCKHSVDSISITNYDSMVCTRCMLHIKITDHLKERYANRFAETNR